MSTLAIQDISTRAMLASLHISMWTNTRTDKQATAVVQDHFQVNSAAGEFKKRLIDPRHLKPMHKKAGEAYQLHRLLTLPWTDEGARILPGAGYFDYTQRMSEKEREFWEVYGEFEAGFQDYVNEARVERKELFEETQYPSTYRLREEFAFMLGFMALSSAADFRVQMSREEFDAVSQQVRESEREVFKRITLDCAERIKDVTARLADRLRKYRVDTEGKVVEGVFRDSLITNIRELTGLLPSLNVLEDPKIVEITEQLRAIQIYEPEELRTDESLRNAVADEADGMLKKLEAFI